MPLPLTTLCTVHSLLAAVLLVSSCTHDPENIQALNPRYRTLTTKLLAREPDSHLESAVLEHVLWRIAGDVDREYERVAALPWSFQVVYATWWLEAEVTNGGFKQYFSNSKGRFANEALKGFEILGARQHAGLVRQAIWIHQARMPILDSARLKGTTAAFSHTYSDDPFAPIDRQFLELKTDLSSLRVAFIRKYYQDFVHR